MKLHIPSVLIAVMICTSCFAQEKSDPAQTTQTEQSQTIQTSTDKQVKPFYMKSSLSLFTYANTNFTPGNIIGASVGAKYFLLNRLAVRGGLTFSTSGTGDGRRRMGEFGFGQNDFNSTMPGNIPGLKGADLTTFGASAYAMYYPVSVGKFNFYTGAGTSYSFYSGRNIDLVNGQRINNYRQNLFNLGALVGTEYNIAKNVNLSLEYNPTYLLNRRNNNNEINEVNGQIGTQNNIRLPGQQKFNATNFNLGAVYYFN